MFTHASFECVFQLILYQPAYNSNGRIWPLTVRNRVVSGSYLVAPLHAAALLPLKVSLCHGLMKCVILAYTLYARSNSSARLQDYFRAFDAIFGKIGRFASEDVILTSFTSKCWPILLYGLEAFALSK